MALGESVKPHTSDAEAPLSMPRGGDVLRDPHMNRWTAFTINERAALGLEGLLPRGMSSLEDQAQMVGDSRRDLGRAEASDNRQ